MTWDRILGLGWAFAYWDLEAIGGLEAIGVAACIHPRAGLHLLP